MNAERSLKAKETKKASEDGRIVTSKIAAISEKLSALRRNEPSVRDNRIFPMAYAGVIIQMDGVNLLTPMRYTCRPAGKPSVYNKKFPGLYNARRDNLDKFWREQFGHHHALMVVESFDENVRAHTMEHRTLAEGERERNVVLEFTL